MKLLDAIIFASEIVQVVFMVMIILHYKQVDSWVDTTSIAFTFKHLWILLCGQVNT
jgi:hypothetical protein